MESRKNCSVGFGARIRTINPRWLHASCIILWNDHVLIKRMPVVQASIVAIHDDVLHGISPDDSSSATTVDLAN